MHTHRGDGPKYFSISSLTDEGGPVPSAERPDAAIQERRAAAQLVKATSSASILRQSLLRVLGLSWIPRHGPHFCWSTHKPNRFPSGASASYPSVLYTCEPVRSLLVQSVRLLHAVDHYVAGGNDVIEVRPSLRGSTEGHSTSSRVDRLLLNPQMRFADCSFASNENRSCSNLSLLLYAYVNLCCHQDGRSNKLFQP